MEKILLIIHVVIAVLLVGAILLQQGKGAEVGASFGSGASQTLFGSQGSAGFLTKFTVILALLFAFTSVSLGKLAVNKTSKNTQAINNIANQNNAPDVPS